MHFACLFAKYCSLFHTHVFVSASAWHCFASHTPCSISKWTSIALKNIKNVQHPFGHTCFLECKSRLRTSQDLRQTLPWRVANNCGMKTKKNCSLVALWLQISNPCKDLKRAQEKGNYKKRQHPIQSLHNSFMLCASQLLPSTSYTTLNWILTEFQCA